MGYIAADSPQVNDLDALAAVVRREHGAAETVITEAQQHALQHALAAGDALLAAREKVTWGWEQWVRRECRIKLRSAQVYMQLARGRAVLQAQSSAPLSIAAALRILNGARKKPRGKKRALSPAVWLAASPEERTKFLSEIGLPANLAAMPASWMKIIEARVLGLRGASGADPDLRLSKIIRTALSHLEIADSPETGKPAAQGQEHAALAALRGANAALRAIGRDLHDVEIVLVTAKSERTSKRRRAA
jgi:hypothetical protein